MAKVDVYTIDGSKKEILDLPDQLFSVRVNPTLIAEAVRVQDANSRVITAHTKDRSEVRGGGRKPWKQKGTGRARHGSRRSPIWIGGGVTFGPNSLRNFFLKINKKAKRKALASILSDKVASNAFIILNELPVEGGTKGLANIRKALPGAQESAVIVTVSNETDAIRAARNLQKTSTISAQSLNVRDLLKSKYVIASKAAVEKMIEIYA
ncbi:50S ribosomal protein L4 [Patescibacteria group bacterium]|nr:50S ribosomal protein L4 [Patescibacteria group bacterium]MBU4452861.1 50S ribosomal protein L4 [Patescibacteria group bacterium]MCG2687565.1 50S ribosomal protein L4 [Candidatus Parcubacteria bacterium]